MRRKLIIALGLSALVSALGACGDEDPTEVGSGLIGDGVRTYEVLLEAGEFLDADTTFDSLSSLNRAGFWLVAQDFASELDGNTLFSVFRPFRVSYQDSSGTTQSDSVAAIVGGTVTLVVDTLASTGAPVDLAVFPLTESWDRATTTWELRSDTADAPEAWTTPGGTAGAEMGSTAWTGGDTVRIVLDSQAVAIWQDTTAARRGGVLRTTTAGARLVLRSVLFQFDVVPVEATDTVVQAGSVRDRVSIVTPDAPPASAGELRVGGLPAWRSMLLFQPLEDRRVGCGPGSDPACTVALKDATINLAALILEPLPAGTRLIERPFWLENRAVLRGPEGAVPLARSPLSGLLGLTRDSLTADLFDGTGPAPDPVQMSVSNFIRRLVNPPDDDPWLWMALTASTEFGAFGYGSFGSLASAAPPRLRLVISVSEEELAR